MIFECLSSWDIIYAKSNEIINGDNEINQRHDMLSDIVYTYIYEDVIIDKPYVTLLLINEFLNNTNLRRIFQIRN